jgi:hypothetical protein
LDDADEQGPSAATVRVRSEAAYRREVEDGRALHGAAAGHGEKARPITPGAPATALRKVENDGNAGAFELIAQNALGRWEQDRSEGLELDRYVVAVKPFGIEDKASGIVRRRNGGGGRVGHARPPLTGPGMSGSSCKKEPDRPGWEIDSLALASTALQPA